MNQEPEEDVIEDPEQMYENVGGRVKFAHGPAGTDRKPVYPAL